jgi:hypothetical protein
MGCLTGARCWPNGVLDGGQMGCQTMARWGARRGPDGMFDRPNRVPNGGLMGWRMEGLFIFKRKNNVFYIRVM